MSSKNVKSLRARVVAEITNSEKRLLSTFVRDYTQSSSIYRNFLVLTDVTLQNYANAFRAAVYGNGQFPKENDYKKELKNYFKQKSSKSPLKNTTRDKEFRRILRNANLFIGRTVFYVPNSFDTIKKLTKDFNETFVQNNISGKKYDHEVFGRNLELDHGNSSSALSHIGGPATLMAYAKKKLELDNSSEYNNFIAKVNANLTTAVDLAFPELDSSSKKQKVDYFNKIITSWEVNMDPNTLRLVAGLSFLITPSSHHANSKKSTEEKKEFQIMQDSIIAVILEEDILNFRGSPSIKDKVAGALIKKGTPKGVGKNLLVTTNITDKVQPKKSKTKNQATLSGKSKKINTKKEKSLNFRAAKGKSQGTLPDIRSFIGILNSKINSTVAKNMGSPALNYRTGRFAESVRIQNIIQTSKGFPSIEYTYMRYPYEVFEYPGTGHPLAQEGQRDPRRLIEGSIREIMAQYAIGRFYTRRV